KPGRQRPAVWSKGHRPNVVVEIDSMLAVKEIPDVSKMLLHPRERLEKLEAPAIGLHVGHLLFDGSQSRFQLLFDRSRDHKPVADRDALFDLGKLFDDRLHQPAQQTRYLRPDEVEGRVDSRAFVVARVSGDRQLE